MKAYKIKKNQTKQKTYIPQIITGDLERRQPKFPYFVFWIVNKPNLDLSKKIKIQIE